MELVWCRICLQGLPKGYPSPIAPEILTLRLRSLVDCVITRRQKSRIDSSDDAGQIGGDWYLAYTRLARIARRTTLIRSSPTFRNHVYLYAPRRAEDRGYTALKAKLRQLESFHVESVQSGVD
ncbi:hypothetical protein BBK36DRAFT_1144526 [Trichoderma citrinoviride]|uniref:Uncharacterized protein n=1 Tax=Trichoderma citrinoviride TaxID=58853 RepID=A0A2T4B0Z1_9HYPO|nr:hypothetical protein BBK36DRAFT_1144526 [Trichoderma citrinoviride]PTB62993.1 hypothetical protein BBK36DRAFT_1144526 [Trichoderma citrinoviride]